MKKNARICIIGAGSSGIATAKNLIQVGFNNIVIYEKSENVGGNWVYTEDAKHSSVYETTHIITSKSHSQFMDYPMPDDYPDYPSHWLMAEYFLNYAKEFGVYDKIEFNTEVKNIIKLDNGTWDVTTDKSENELFDALFICNGHHFKPRMPEYKGNFEGEYIHSHYFKNNKPFVDKRVLIIGAGNSGCDAAVETCRVAKETAISMRRGYYFIPKFVMGYPSDVLANKFQFLPDFLLDPSYRLMLFFQFGKFEDYGLQKPNYGVRQSHPVANSELPYYIRHGKITPRVDIDRFEGKMVHFKDGAKQEFDTIIAATGYKIMLPFFDKNFIDYEDGDVPLYKRMFHPEHNNLFFIGLIQASGCFWVLADIQAKLVANAMAGNYKLPSDMNQAIEQQVNHANKYFTKSARHKIEVDYFKYSKELLKLIPSNAPKWK